MLVRRGATYRRRGMGSAFNPCACQWPLPGVPAIPNTPMCDPATGGAPGCSAAQVAAPFCSGIPYGQPGYADCISRAAGTTTVGPFTTQTPVNQAPYQAILASLPPPPPPPAPVAAPSPPVQSNAPNQTPVGISAPVQSNAPTPTYATPVSSVAQACFGFFSGEPCLGPIGMYTLLAGAAVAFGAMTLFGGHHR